MAAEIVPLVMVIAAVLFEMVVVNAQRIEFVWRKTSLLLEFARRSRYNVLTGFDRAARNLDLDSGKIWLIEDKQMPIPNGIDQDLDGIRPHHFLALAP